MLGETWTRRAWLALAAACLCSAGCIPGRGYLLRGDWSLELNRVPWIGSRTEAYDEKGTGRSDVLMGCDGPLSLEMGSCGSCGAALGHGPAHTAHPMVPPTAPAAGAGEGDLGDAGLGSSPFHPVPTQPVFSRRTVGCLGGGSMCFPARQATPPRSLAPLAPLPPTAEPEVIPAPPAEPDTAQSAAVPRRLHSAESGRASWVFPPAQPMNSAVASRPETDPGLRWVTR